MASGPRRDDDGTGGEPPPFSDEGVRRIIYGQDGDGPQDSRSAAFAEDTADLEANLRGRRSLVPIVTAMAALFCFGAIVWYAYSWGTGKMTSDELPVVVAEPMPEKTRPEQPGGLEVPHQDKMVLNDGLEGEGAPRVERLLPQAEIPQPPQPLEPPASQTAEMRPEDQMPEQIPEAPLVAESPAAAATEEMVAEESTPAEMPEPPEMAAAAEIAKPVPRPEAQESGAGDQIAALLEQEPLETANGPATDAQTDSALPEATPGAQIAAISPGDVVLQLSSVKSEAAAAQEWVRLQKAHPALLGDRPLTLETAEVKGATYYRVQTGPFASRGAAADLCAQLKVKNQDCIVKQR